MTRWLKRRAGAVQKKLYVRLDIVEDRRDEIIRQAVMELSDEDLVLVEAVMQSAASGVRAALTSEHDAAVGRYVAVVDKTAKRLTGRSFMELTQRD